MTEVQTDLARLEQAERMLAQVATVEDAVALRDLAEAARVAAKQAKLGTASINHATVVKLRAERRIAEYVDAGQAAGQIADQRIGRPSDFEGLSTYAGLGLVPRQVHEARTIRNSYGDAELVALGTAATVADRLLSRDKIVRSAGSDDWFYIELMHRPPGSSRYVPSGINRTESDVWAVSIGSTGVVVLFPTPLLRSAIRAEPMLGKPQRNTAGDCPTKGRLLRLVTVLNYAEQVWENLG